jgi:hypothetical protein
VAHSEGGLATSRFLSGAATLCLILATRSEAATYSLAGDDWATSHLASVGLPLTGSLSVDFSDPLAISADGTWQTHVSVDLPSPGPQGHVTVDITGTIHATHGVLSGTDVLWSGSTDAQVGESGILTATGFACTALAPACTGDGVPFTLAALVQASGATLVPVPLDFGTWTFNADFSYLQSSQIVLARFDAGNPLGLPAGASQQYLLMTGSAVPAPEPTGLALVAASLALLGTAQSRAPRASRASPTNTSRASLASTSRPNGT